MQAQDNAIVIFCLRLDDASSLYLERNQEERVKGRWWWMRFSFAYIIRSGWEVVDIRRERDRGRGGTKGQRRLQEEKR